MSVDRYKTYEDGNVTKVIVDHPDFGHVVFTNPTSRQLDILNKYKELSVRCNMDKPVKSEKA